MSALALLLALLSPAPCTSFELLEDASLYCDGSTYPEGSYVLHHDRDDGDILGASAYRATCDTYESGPCAYFEAKAGITYTEEETRVRR